MSHISALRWEVTKQLRMQSPGPSTRRHAEEGITYKATEGAACRRARTNRQLGSASRPGVALEDEGNERVN